jgi:Tol biopolymer transport system component
MRETVVALLAVSALAAAAGDAAQPRLPGRIVFATDRGGNVDNAELYSVRVDGRGRRALSRNPGADGRAAWSPDGRRIAFRSERFEDGRRLQSLYVMGADGRGPRRLTPANLTVLADADGGLSWSPDGTRLVFDAARGLQPGIWIVRADGSGLRRLASGFEPVWAPRGELIAFQSRGIRVISARGGAARRLTRGDGDGFAEWSPDGRRLAFLRNVESRQTQILYTVPARGGPLRRLFGGGRDVLIPRRPQWSRDGSRIVFAAGRGIFHVHVVRSRAGGVRRLQRGDWPAWSPDGRRIAFTLGSVLRVMNSDGTRSRRVLSEGASDFSAGPAWSPDGRTLLYATFRLQSDLEIAVVDADGTRLRQLTRNRARDHSPAWSADRRRIAFVRSGAVWLMNADGSRQRRLVAGTSPTWSPGGREIAFATSRGVEIVGAGGGSQRLLTVGSLPAWSSRVHRLALARGLRVLLVDPVSGGERTLASYERACPVAPELTSIAGLDWSPDGQRLLVTLVCDDGRSASVSANVVRADGEGGAALPIDEIFPTRVAFSPDGRRVAFVTELGAARLATERLDGTGRTTVLRGDEGQVVDPDW